MGTQIPILRITKTSIQIRTNRTKKEIWINFNFNQKIKKWIWSRKNKSTHLGNDSKSRKKISIRNICK